MLLIATLKRAQPVTFSLRGLLPRRLLAWTIHENAQFSLAPFAHRKFCSVGNTVCIPLLLKIPCAQRVRRDNRTFHE